MSFPENRLVNSGAIIHSNTWLSEVQSSHYLFVSGGDPIQHRKNFDFIQALNWKFDLHFTHILMSLYKYILQSYNYFFILAT